MKLKILSAALLFVTHLNIYAADITIQVSDSEVLQPIPPGVVGWGAMWKQKMLWPAPPASMTDQQHQAYIRQLGLRNLSQVQAADMRNISWPWGVSFSTWGVNWENSAKPWSQRVADCARILNRTSPWCEKTVVGVGDLMALADIWQLEALTVAVPLAVIDGRRTRWGPGFFDQTFSDHTIEQIADHGYRLVELMKQQPGWKRLQRVYLSAGTEWRHYRLRNPSSAVLSYAKLLRRLREKIADSKVIIVGSASDSTDIPGIKHQQAISWNRYLYRELHNVPGIALDLHRYRGMIGTQADSNGRTPLNFHNVEAMLATGAGQRQYLTVKPADWGESGPTMPTVLLENAIHGRMADHSTHSSQPIPWPVAMAHADLVREALASEALTFLGWTWFPEDLPEEWPHGALRPDGRLSAPARAQGFLSHYHRGNRVNLTISDESAIRANAVVGAKGKLALYGGNFSQQANRLRIGLLHKGKVAGSLELMSAAGIHQQSLTLPATISLPSLTLWRWQAR
ncbi:hypothetical protein [Marinobacterium jannaschii]|uniref:hypothetical protein n=1 Tax=Marinobacterium jannaschii TaxID=64970 RepID=UPI00047F7A45|nr:hypothetical protein [Marinobacterium jannaschii]